MGAEKYSRSTKIGVGIAIFPVVIGAVYAAPVGSVDGLFLYTVSGIVYSLGAQGYTVNGAQAIITNKTFNFDYTTPKTWPEPIRGLPKLLVAHFAIFILLAMYVVIYFTTLATLYYRIPKDKRDKNSDGHKAIRQTVRQRGYLGWISALMAALVLGLTAADGVIVVKAWQGVGLRGTFKPTSLGYALGIVGGIFGTLWLISLTILFFKYREDTAGKKSKK